MNSKLLIQYGAHQSDYETALRFGLSLARTTSQHHDIYTVVTDKQNEVVRYASVSGKFRFEANKAIDYPAVGDFVLLDELDNLDEHAVIHQVLPRRSIFVRAAAGSKDPQVIASNVDFAFICTSCNADFNVRRLERYLAVAWDSGAIPLIVLTKSDLAKDLEQYILDVETAALGVEILSVQSNLQSDIDQLRRRILPGKTAVFLGSSGVGKSTMINRLLGAESLATFEIRSDDKGRHTSTSREMFLLPGGGVVIDTPGMRELGLSQSNVEGAFDDIQILSKKCKFYDCSHKPNQSGCAVQEAIANRELSQERFESYLKLLNEQTYEGLNTKQIEEAKWNRIVSQVGGKKNFRNLIKDVRKRR